MPALLTAIADLYAAETTPCDGMLASAAIELRELAGQAPRPETPLRVPVSGVLPAVLADARRGPLAAMADAFDGYAATARWRQNPNYTVDTIGQSFLDRYGYVELVGRDRPWHSEQLAVGFLLLGAGAHYPAHHHPAAEVYHVVAGTARWRKGDEALSLQPMGAAIYHAPHVVHETRVHGEPLLALYCWRGDIGVAAQLTATRADT
jgi:mannose-6-phosphate isomerase-like protein (cupin superfamily)